MQCPNNDCGPRAVVYQGRRTLAFFNGYANGYQGYVPIGARYIGNGNFIALSSGPRRINNNSRNDTNFSRLNGARVEAQLGRTVDGDAFASFVPGHGARPAKVYLHPFQYYTSPNNSMAQLHYAYTALHETFHLVARGGYSDVDMARVVFALTGAKGLPPEGTTDQMPWSDYWNSYLQRHCMPKYLSDIK